MSNSLLNGLLVGLGIALIRWANEISRSGSTNPFPALSRRKEKLVWNLIHSKGEFTRDNIWLLYYFSPAHLYTKYIKENKLLFTGMDEATNTIHYTIINNPFDKKIIGTCSLRYSPETFDNLANLFTKTVFKHIFGNEYDIIVDFIPGNFLELSKAYDDERGLVDVCVTYRIKREKADTKKKKYMYVREYTGCTAGEFKDIFYKYIDWQDNIPAEREPLT
jgi:hypothetical protein